MKKSSGNKTDRRGNWTKGKRRNEPGSDWARVRKRLERLLRDPQRKATEGLPGRSRAGLAAWLGVSDRAVRRWLSGEDMPSAESVAAMAEYCRLLS